MKKLRRGFGTSRRKPDHSGSAAGSPAASPVIPVKTRRSSWVRWMLPAGIAAIALLVLAISYFARPTASEKDPSSDDSASASPRASANAPKVPFIPTGVPAADWLLAAAEAITLTDGMVWIHGGRFRMGFDDPEFPDAQPVHEVELDGFWMDRTEVTNAQFARFVQETGYKTYAEEPHDGLPAGSFAFRPPPGKVSLENPYQWWQFVNGADWRHPEGPASTIEGKEDHPVVHASWNDAVAYAKWAGKRLPTEAEWEYAARGGLDGREYAWGDELKPGGKWMANIWQGHFPDENTAADGYPRTAPVGSFPRNGHGLYDMAGNVWEWCADWYRPDSYRISPRKNPPGPEYSHDPLEPGVGKRVQRGGSFMCSDVYCKRYRPGGRGKGEVTSAAFHVGFRCVR